VLDRRRYLRHIDHPEHHAGDSEDEFELPARAGAAIEAPGKLLMKPTREPVSDVSNLSNSQAVSLLLLTIYIKKKPTVFFFF